MKLFLYISLGSFLFAFLHSPCARGEADLPPGDLPPPTASAGLTPEEGEVRLEGTIEEIRPGEGNFTMAVTHVTEEGATTAELPDIRTKLVIVNSLTLLHVRGNPKSTVELSRLSVGDRVIVVGIDLGVGMMLPAREVAAWNRQGSGAFHLDLAPAERAIPNTAAMPLPRWCALKAVLEHGVPVNAAAFSPDGKMLATAGGIQEKPGEVRLWNGKTGELEMVLDGPQPVETLALPFGPEAPGTVAVPTGSVPSIQLPTPPHPEPSITGPLISSPSLPPPLETPGPPGLPSKLVGPLLPGRPSIMDGPSVSGLPSIMEGPSLPGGIFLSGGMAPLVVTLAFSPDGKLIATGGGQEYRPGQARLWDARTGALQSTLVGVGNWVEKVVFSPDGLMLATASDDSTVGLWDVTSGSLKATLKGHSDFIKDLTFSPDGSTLATASADGTALLWDTQVGEPKAFLHGHKGPIWAIAFSPDGKSLATAGADGTARIWDTTGRLITTLEGHTEDVLALSFSANGKLLVTTSSDHTARIWELPAGNLRATLEGHTRAIWATAFSPDGSRVATGSDDGTARLWKTSNGDLLAVLQGHTDWIKALAFSPDGKTLATASADRTVRLWDLAASGRANRPGNKAEALHSGDQSDR